MRGRGQEPIGSAQCRATAYQHGCNGGTLLHHKCPRSGRPGSKTCMNKANIRLDWVLGDAYSRCGSRMLHHKDAQYDDVGKAKASHHCSRGGVWSSHAGQCEGVLH